MTQTCSDLTLARQLVAPSQVERPRVVLTERWTDDAWDLIVLCFAHLPPEVMPGVHGACAAALKPGGRVVLNSFARSQFGRKSGGPPRLEWLHEIEELQGQFPGLVIEAVETEVELAESVGHQGLAMVIELVGCKSAE